MSDSYSKLGASASKQGLHAALKSSGLEQNAGLFSSVYPDAAGSAEHRSFLHCDGAGTKSIVAYLLYRETGDAKHFAGLAQDALVMNLDDVFCIGEPEGLLLSNLIARNASLVPDEVLSVLLGAYRELQERMREAGIEITLSGGETADCGDVVRTLLVDAVLAGRIANARLIRASGIRPGAAIVGLSSTGRARGESIENSGIGSNGLTLARHALLSKDAERYPEVVDPGLPKELRYRGPFRVTDSADGLSSSVGEALLSPTRSYAPLLREIYRALPGRIQGVIHCTGGGQTKVLRFSKGCFFLKDRPFSVPPLFSLIQRSGGIAWKEMYQVFNMGHRMELYLDPADCSRVIDLAAAYGIAAQQIGSVRESERGGANHLRLITESGELEYSLAE